jgi:predicted nucleic acid-binding protein
VTRYLLDTNIVSDLQTDTEAGEKILNKLKHLDRGDEVAVSIIVLYELTYGLHNLVDKGQKEAVQQGIDFIKEYLTLVPLDLREVDLCPTQNTP